MWTLRVNNINMLDEYSVCVEGKKTALTALHFVDICVSNQRRTGEIPWRSTRRCRNSILSTFTANEGERFCRACSSRCIDIFILCRGWIVEIPTQWRCQLLSNVLWKNCSFLIRIDLFGNQRYSSSSTYTSCVAHTAVNSASSRCMTVCYLQLLSSLVWFCCQATVDPWWSELSCAIDPC